MSNQIQPLRAEIKRLTRILNTPHFEPFPEAAAIRGEAYTASLLDHGASDDRRGEEPAPQGAGTIRPEGKE